MKEQYQEPAGCTRPVSTLRALRRVHPTAPVEVVSAVNVAESAAWYFASTLRAAAKVPFATFVLERVPHRRGLRSSTARYRIQARANVSNETAVDSVATFIRSHARRRRTLPIELDTIQGNLSFVYISRK